jgi:lipoprotein-releasing system permease protein
MSYESLIGTRYVRSTRGRGFVSFISVVSAAGLAIGVAVLIVVLSVMNGFGRELRTRILSVTSHATLWGLEGPLEDWRQYQAQALKMPGVIAAVPYIEEQALLTHGAHTTGTVVRGVEPEQERRAVGLAEHIQGGTIEDLNSGGYRIILGDALAQALAVKVGDDVVLIAPQGNATPVGIEPRMRRFRVSGIFHSGMYKYDRALALLNLHDAARVYQLGDAVTGIRLALADPFAASRTVHQLAQALVDASGPGFNVSDWTRVEGGLFRSIEITKSMLFVILLLVVAVAAFNIVAALVMVVKEKRSDIAILRTLGAGPRNILAAFSIQGGFIGLAGTLAGAGLGLLLSANLESLVHGLEHLLGTHFMDAKVYLMSDLPAYAEAGDVLRICGVSFALCALATLYPAWRASSIAPAEALRRD